MLPIIQKYTISHIFTHICLHHNATWTIHKSYNLLIRIIECLELNVLTFQSSTCQLTQVWDRSRISFSTCMCLFICLFVFLREIAKPHIQMRNEDKTDIRELNSKDLFLLKSVILFHLTHRHVVFYTHAHTNANYLQCYQSLSSLFLFFSFLLFILRFEEIGSNN